MRIHIATVGDHEDNLVQHRDIAELAEADTVGVHSAERDPEVADAILFVDLHQHSDDNFLRALWRHELVRTHPGKVFAMEQRDRPFFTVPGIYMSANSNSGFRRLMRGGPYPKMPNQFFPTEVEPDLLFSFQGARTYPVRDRMLALQHARAVLEDTSHVGFFPWEPTPTPEARKRRSGQICERGPAVEVRVVPTGVGYVVLSPLRGNECRTRACGHQRPLAGPAQSGLGQLHRESSRTLCRHDSGDPRAGGARLGREAARGSGRLGTAL